MPAASPNPTATAPILVLDAASGQTLVAIVSTALLAEQTDSERGAATERLPSLVATTLATAELAPGDLAAIAVTVGPGSFTGLRAALAFAHGLASGANLPLVGVTLAEALRASVTAANHPVWIALDSRRGRIFLDRDSQVAPFAAEDLPCPLTPITVAGDAAHTVVTLLTSRGATATLNPTTHASAQAIAAVARQRLSGQRPPLAAMPLYVDPPEAKLPAGGLRPAPV